MTLGGFWTVRLEIEHAKATILKMIDELTTHDHLKELVDDAVKQFDFEGTVRAAVVEHMQRQLSEQVKWAISRALTDAELQRALIKPIKAALVRSLDLKE